MIHGKELQERLKRPMSLLENIKKIKEDTERKIDQIAVEIENDIAIKNHYRTNPLVKFDAEGLIGKNNDVRNEIRSWLKTHGYSLKWNYPQNAFCVYIKD